MPWLVPWTWCSPLCTAIGHGHEDIAVLFLGSPGIALPPSPRQPYRFPLDATMEEILNGMVDDGFGRCSQLLAVAIENGHLTIVGLLLRAPARHSG